jgi:G:T-mismatch repair DNA endonuclease (very short patch repair protein)
VALGKTGGVPSAVPKPGESLADLFPDVATQWHPTKNGDLTPEDVFSGSNKKVWWKCPVADDHEWNASANNRSRIGRGCGFCAGQRVSVTNSLQALLPEIAAQWHPTRNGELTAADVTTASNKKVWWKCSVADDHEWTAPPHKRTLRGDGCPCCAGHRPSVTNRLDTQFPEIAAEWHPTRNGDLTPGDVVAGSNKRIWWKCPVADDHEWEAPPYKRTLRGDGCPCCVGKQLSVTNRLDLLFPEIAAQWHPIKNGELTAADVVHGTHQVVWWKCPVADDHQWQSMVKGRVGGSGCLCCAGQQLSVTNRLDLQFPKIAAEWHPTRNGDLTPADVVHGSGQSAWWQCPVASDHEWSVRVVNRTLGSGCPCCAGKQLSVTNSLAAAHPRVAATWHPTRNGDLTPDQVLGGPAIKYWWKCDVVPEHEWDATANSRTSGGSGCPSCTLTPRSAQEMRLAHELSALIDFDLEAHKVRFAGRLRDVDIVLDALKVVVEFDGVYWHRNKVDKDREKTALMEEAGWQVIRVRERPLDSIHVNDVMVDTMAPAKTVADLVLNKIVEVTGTDVPQVNEYLASEGPWREAQALKAIRAYQAERAAKKAVRANKAE